MSRRAPRASLAALSGLSVLAIAGVSYASVVGTDARAVVVSSQGSAAEPRQRLIDRRPYPIYEYEAPVYNLAEMIATADDVVVGRIVAERRGPEVHEQADTSARRILQLEVETSVKARSSTGSDIDLELPGWLKSHDRPELAMPDAHGLRLLVGDRVVVALVEQQGPQGQVRRGLLYGDAAFLLEGGEVVDTGREGTLAKQAEALTETGLLALLKTG